MGKTGWALPETAWKIWYPDGQAECKAGQECPASIQNKKLWQSPYTRTKANLAEHYNRLEEKDVRYFWLGAEIPAEAVTAASRAGYDQFFVGSVFSDVDVWVNGTLTQKFNFRTSRKFLSVPIPQSLLKAGQSVYLAFEIKVPEGEVYPDSFDPAATGLASSDQVNFIQQYEDFKSLDIPFLVIGFSLALSFFFGCLWVLLRQQEYIFFSAFNLLQAASQGLALPAVWAQMGSHAWYEFNFLGTSAEACLILFVALSYARQRNFLFFAAITSLLALTVPVTVLATGNFLWEAAVFCTAYITPVCYGLGAIVCFTESYRTRSALVKSQLNDRWRSEKLLGFGLTLFAIAALYKLAHLGSDAVADDIPLFFKLANSLAVGVMTTFVISEIRRNHVFIEKLSLSRFHRRASLPSQVPCALVVLDLKNSELLFQSGPDAETGDALVGDIIQRCAHLLLSAGAELISTEGDSIHCLFEVDTNREECAKKATLALAKVADELAILSDELGRAGNRVDAISFRSTFSFGALRPVWKIVQGKRKPQWEACGEKNIFVDTARLLEAEKTFALRGVSTLIAGLEDTLAVRDESHLSALHKNYSVTVKHGKLLRVGLWQVSKKENMARAIAA